MPAPSTELQIAPGTEPLSIRQIAEVLVRHFNLHDGLYEASFEFGLAVGSFRSPENVAAPGVITTLNKIGLVIAQSEGPNTVDASKVNPPAATKAPRVKRRI